MAGSALICAFVMVVLATPGSEVHRSTGDTGGAESWMMAIGGAIAWGILYDGKAPRDERDRVIDHRAQRAGYAALVIFLLVFLALLGFMPRPGMARFTHWLIANTLLLLVMLSGLVQYVVQLAHYVNDRRNSGIANG